MAGKKKAHRKKKSNPLVDDVVSLYVSGAIRFTGESGKTYEIHALPYAEPSFMRAVSSLPLKIYSGGKLARIIYPSCDIRFLEARRFTNNEICPICTVGTIDLHGVTDSDTFRKKGRG